MMWQRAVSSIDDGLPPERSMLEPDRPMLLQPELVPESNEHDESERTFQPIDDDDVGTGVGLGRLGRAGRTDR